MNSDRMQDLELTRAGAPRGWRVAIAGGGISGLAAAWELARQGIEFTLFEASARLGGIVESVRERDFAIECGPDSWVAEKPWARELAVELGLEKQIIFSNDHWRRTYLLQGSLSEQGPAPRLAAIPDGMRMMVPTRWGPLLESPLLSWQARLAYLREPKRAAEFKACAPDRDEPIAEFVRRHFGDEVTETLAAPLLAAVLGGDIASLSARAVLPAFVKMEREQGSLVQALMAREAQRGKESGAVFATLAGGLEAFVEKMAAALPAGSVQMRRPVLGIARDAMGWRVATAQGESIFDALVLAAPPQSTAKLLGPIAGGARMADLLPRNASSAAIVALAFPPERAARMRIPRGFGFVVPPQRSQSGANRSMLACTFVDQKFPHRAPEGGAILRAFFGGMGSEEILQEPDEILAEMARGQLSRILGALPEPATVVVRRWPQSLPQYEVGHVERIAELESLAATQGNLHLIGNAYHGVGLPDLIRDGRAAARSLAAASPQFSQQR